MNNPLSINNQYIKDPAPDFMRITNDAGETIVRVMENGNVEINGSVNDAAIRFWLGVAQFADGDLIIKIKEKLK